MNRDVEFMRVARSLSVQDSRALRGYARAGLVYLPGRTRSGALDEALEIVGDGRQVRTHWASLRVVPTPLGREESPGVHVAVA